jgi:hypothetical protein
LRSSEEMAYALYLADCQYDFIGTPGSSVQPRTWDELDYEEEQQMYQRHVETLLKFLFEHGRISAYLNAQQLEEFKEEYRAYLQQKNRGE